MATKKKIVDTEVWPKITKGSHLTVIEHKSGKTELTWDDEALLKDVQNAILKFESNIPAKSSTVLTKTKKPAKVSKVETKRKKQNEA